ncbi:alpha-L-fucosidase [Salegentibacter echinorum]|nr:alpha-L-fucosidase [Salegentibacter echinorum]
MIKKISSLVFLFSIFSGFAQQAIEMPVSNTIKIQDSDSKSDIITKAAHVVPTQNQLTALKDGFIAFIHFGPNTFTKKEWGTGEEDPEVFQLENLDTDQWCKAIKDAGMTKVIFTAKHHDGFVLWQSRYTKQGIMSSPFRNGEGDIMKALAKSCEKYGLKLGVYLSPADLYQIENKDGLYGNLSEASLRTIPRKVEGRPFENKTTFEFKVDDYNEYFLNQLFELLTEYGPIHEVWFDGAHPKRKGGQTYNYAAWKELIHTLAPEAVIFGKEDIRWGGNESGETRKTEWNVIPFKGNPNNLEVFGDLTADTLGNRSQLYDAEYLHYQPAEINTSIREGWFYRDEETQKVRSADDVFDIYERAVGGNAIFLLNMPPNREGLLSPEDVGVLKEVGERLEETYAEDLFKEAEANEALLDNNLETFKITKDNNEFINIKTKQPVTINRVLLQEAVATHGERIEEHSFEAKINGEWQEVARASNVGFKRILRFPEITSNEFRLKILQSRLQPAVAKISAHFYKKRPPQLEISRDSEGMVRIEPKKDEFTWKRDMSQVPETAKVEIKYSLDGVTQSYKDSFRLKEGTVEAYAVKDSLQGSTASRTFGMLKQDWKATADSFSGENSPQLAIDANENTFWISGPKGSPHYLEIEMQQKKQIKAFSYTPKASEKMSMIEKGEIKISEDGEEWETVSNFEFGNLINDPTTRTHYFEEPINTRFIKIEVKRIAGDGKTAAAAEIDFYSK